MMKNALCMSVIASLHVLFVRVAGDIPGNTTVEAVPPDNGTFTTTRSPVGTPTAISANTKMLAAVFPDNSTPEAISLDKGTLEAVSSDNSMLEAVSPDISTMQAASPDNSTLEAVSPGNNTMQAASPDNSTLEAVSPDNSTLDTSPDNGTFTSTNFPSRTPSADSANTNKLVAVPADNSKPVDDFTTQIRENYYFCGRLKEKLVLAPEFHPCGDSNCLCQSTYADCSGKGLNYVPRLPDNILHVSFSSNGIGPIIHDDVFRNVTNVFSLDLSDNDISHIHAGVFRTLKNLKALMLPVNKLTYESLTPVLNISTLEYLDVSENERLGPIPDGLFHQLRMRRLVTLCLTRTSMNVLNITSLTPLTSLGTLYLSYNPISQITSDFLPNLTTIVLWGCSLVHLLTTCRNGFPLFPRLMELDLAFNNIDQSAFDADLLPTVCLPNLRFLSLRGNNINEFLEGVFDGHRFPALGTLDVRDLQYPIARVEKDAFRNTRLEEILLSGNNLDFASDTVHPQSFAGCPRLLTLNVSQNDLRSVTTERFLELFGRLKRLRRLILCSTNMDSVSAAQFSAFTELTFLDLSKNKLTELPDGVFDELETLSELDLSDNRISLLRERTFGPALRRSLVHLSLDQNPFLCSCELRWFQNWLVSNRSLFNPSYAGFVCNNLPNTTVQRFHVADQACLLTRTTETLIIFSISMVILVLVLSATLFRFRWHIRLFIYEAFRGQGDNLRLRRLREQHFDYDVFVSYDSEDLSWVRAHLMPELESLGLKLCVHERDFIPGVNIVDNIVDCVEKSKKVMMLFSTYFAKSHWCQFELNFCMNHVMEIDDALLVVFLHDVPSRDLTPAMMAVMKTTTYIEWEPDDPEARDAFWRRILIALNEILPRQ